MFYKYCHFRILAICLISLAIVVGCASDPAQKTNQKAETALIVPASPAAKIVENNQSTSDTAQAKTTEAVKEDTTGSSTASNPPITAIDEADYSDQYVNGKKLSIPKITGSVPPRDDEYHDTDNNAIVVLQSPTEAMSNFPRDRRKEVDWVKTLDQGLIEPRANLKGGDDMVTMDLDIIMKNTQFMPWVKFPHLQHTKWLACQNCHPKIFIPQENANPISMNKVLRGEYCGVCHDKVSFALFICERCHSIPHEGSGPAWWK